MKAISTDDAYFVLEAAQNVVFIPGYGMAVAQAQHAVKELAEILENNGAEVSFAIHPVAGRMPGHMNVLLAEADVPYEQLKEMEEANRILEMADVAIVIGANDVVNPAAAEDKGSRFTECRLSKRSRQKRFSPLNEAKARDFPDSKTDCSSVPIRAWFTATPRRPSTSLWQNSKKNKTFAFYETTRGKIFSAGFFVRCVLRVFAFPKD